MLSSITLENFKTFESGKVALAKVTALIGPNGAGKSSFPESLMLLRQSFNQNTAKLQGDFLNLPNSSPFVLSKEIGEPVGITIGGRRRVLAGEVSFLYRLLLGQDASVQESKVRLEGPGVSIEETWNGETPEPHDYQLGDTRFSARAEGRIGRPLVVNAFYTPSGQQEVSSLLGAIETEMNSWRFVPALRGFAQALFKIQNERLTELKAAADHAQLSAGIVSTMGMEEETATTVSQWITQVTGVPVKYGLAEQLQITLSSLGSTGHRSIPIVSEGFGTNQLVWMMFQLAKTPDGGLIAIEEPEIHLHPLAISRLGDLLADIATTKDRQILMTTHSDHLLYSLLNNVASGKLRAEDLSIYYLSGDSAADPLTPKMHVLEVTKEGFVRGGLPGFYDATLAAQKRHLEALQDRNL